MRYDLLALPTAGLDQQLGFFSSTDTKQAFSIHRTPSAHVTGISSSGYSESRFHTLGVRHSIKTVLWHWDKGKKSLTGSFVRGSRAISTSMNKSPPRQRN